MLLKVTRVIFPTHDQCLSILDDSNGERGESYGLNATFKNICECPWQFRYNVHVVKCHLHVHVFVWDTNQWSWSTDDLYV
jgi:hypothetical protein